MKLRGWLLSLAVSSASLSCAAASAFLSPKQAIAAIMDGRPWTARTADGDEASLTLDSKGGGDFAVGPMSAKVNWTVKQDEICIDVGFAGRKCVRFKTRLHGFEGWDGERLDLSLSRWIGR